VVFNSLYSNGSTFERPLFDPRYNILLQDSLDITLGHAELDAAECKSYRVGREQLIKESPDRTKDD
jgi:hypothetical protein